MKICISEEVNLNLNPIMQMTTLGDNLWYKYIPKGDPPLKQKPRLIDRSDNNARFNNNEIIDVLDAV